MILVDAVYIFNSLNSFFHLDQGAFVLFRLFRKPEERTDVVKYEEIEQIGYSPTVAKSSPDNASSDLIQETATSDLHSGKQSGDIKMWLTESDNLTTNSVIPVDSCSNSHATSDIEDQVPEATAVEVSTGFCILVSCTPVKIKHYEKVVVVVVFRHIRCWMKVLFYTSLCLVNLIVKFSPQCNHVFRQT